jgi:cytochrome c
MAIWIALAGCLAAASAWANADGGNAQRGARIFRVCAACHSLEPGRNLTGPSLAGVFGRKAGTLASFLRYSPALRRSNIAWDERTLDAWLRDPQALVPGNYMSFRGLTDAKSRTDLIAYLRAAPHAADSSGSRGLPDLKTAPPEARVTALRHCGDSYFVTTADGTTTPFWDFNLRFKTDASTLGPAPGNPVLLGAGMRGDRAHIVFSRPEEISSFVKEDCDLVKR